MIAALERAARRQGKSIAQLLEQLVAPFSLRGKTMVHDVETWPRARSSSLTFSRLWIPAWVRK